MISFSDFVPDGQSPIYQQIVLYIQRGLAAGLIRDGDELPSRRALSALLGVNPNTVQKSYRLLEEAGIIASTPGAKSCVTTTPARNDRIRAQLLEDQARAVVCAMRQMRVSKAEALAAIERLWEETPADPPDPF
ncbi:MAG: GntR family transcriptional regulator [Butyricicoccaceae bacterium]